jgi:hypothetical protein
LQTIKGKHGPIKEDTVVVTVAVCGVNIVEALWELNKSSVITISLI